MSSLRRATALMTVGTVFSRFTGLLRIMAIATALGAVEAGSLGDAYNLGNTAPNIIYELVLGGVLTSVFVPVFVELLEKEGREKTWEVASALINVSMLVLFVITIIGVLAAPLIAHFYTLNVEGPRAALQQDTLTFLLRLFIPQIIFYALTAITAGLLNAHKRFGPPMFTPVLNNLIVIAIFLTFHSLYGRVRLGEVSDKQLMIIGLGTTLGVVLMALAQIPFLKGLGRYRLTFSLAHPSIKKLGRLSVFVIGYVVTNQIGYLVVQVLAAGEPGGYAAYVYAFTFFMLPHGLFAVSVITALLPSMSEHAVNKRWDAFRDRLSTGVRATILLILPAAVGYFVLGDRIVRLLIEYGNFTAESTQVVSGVLRFFVIGLLPFSLFQLFLRAYYAQQDTKTPFLINCGAVALNISVNIPMFAWLGVEGLAAGHALSYVFGVFVEARILSRRIGGLGGRALVGAAGRIAVAAAGMGALVWAVAESVSGLVGEEGMVGQILVLAAAVIVGLASYLGFAVLLKVPELQLASGLIGSKFKPRAPKGR